MTIREQPPPALPTANHTRLVLGMRGGEVVQIGTGPDRVLIEFLRDATYGVRVAIVAPRQTPIERLNTRRTT